MKSQNNWSSNKKSKNYQKIGIPAFKLLLVLAIILTALSLWNPFRSEKIPNTLSFSYSPNQSSEIIEIPLTEKSEVLYGTSGVVAERSNQLSNFPQFFNDRYIPSNWLFIRVKERAYWRSLKAEVYGLSEEDLGEPAEGISLFNPLLLVAPKFYPFVPRPAYEIRSDYKKDQVGQIISFNYKPSHKLFTLSCKVSDVINRRFGGIDKEHKAVTFGVSTYNAVDMGFLKARVAEGSYNINYPSTDIVNLISFIGYSENGCGPNVGCNALKSVPPAFAGFQIGALPAKLSLELWRGADIDPNSPDLTFDIKFL